MSAGKSTTSHFEALDGLRGVAAVLVLIGHGTAIMYGWTIVPRAQLAVEFFFMLSGFVVAYAYEKKLQAGMPVREFYLRRIVRLYPLIIASIPLGVVSLHFTDRHFSIANGDWVGIVSAIFCLPVWNARLAMWDFTINLPEWSLFFEVAAYAAFGALAGKVSTRNLIALCALFFIGYVLFDKAYFAQLRPPLFSNTPGAAFAFTAGIVLWRLRAGNRLPHWNIPFSVLALAVGVPCVLSRSFGSVFDDISVVMAFPLVIIAGASKTRGIAGKFERFLGDLSFPLYILHWPIILIIEAKLTPHLGPLPTLIIACASAITVAWAAFVLFDRPFRGWLSEKLFMRQRQAMAA